MKAPWVTLRELVEPKKDKRNPSTRPDEVFTYVEVSAVDNVRKTITGATPMTGAEAPTRARRRMRTKDVIVSTVRPLLNAVAMVPPSLDGEVCSTAFCVLRATPRVLPEYLFFFVLSPPFLAEMRRLQRGGLYPAVTESIILDQELPLPDMSEQQRLVDEMLHAHNAVRLSRECREHTLRLNHLVLLDVFGDTVANPKGWPVVPLESLLKSAPQNGLHKPAAAYEAVRESDEGTRIVRINSFYEGLLNEQDSLRRLQLDDKDVQRYALDEDDILVNRVNSPELVGKSAIVPKLTEPTVFESNVMRLKVDTEKTMPRFIIETLQTKRTREHFRIHAKRAVGQSSLNQQDLKSLPVMLPPLEKQVLFANYGNKTARAAALLDGMRKGADAALAALLTRTYAPGG